MTLNAKQRAQRSAQTMWDNDNASPWFGMELTHVDEGQAEMTLTVTQNHTNGHGICHGGVTFALADSTFAFACNSRNQNTVAQHNMVSYIAPARLGDQLTARATEVSLQGRTGIYDVTVTNQDAVTIAEFRGVSRAIKGQLFDEANET
ncbi:MAG: hydroxyphenylacetyl-CoA thioesterase PaaI [Paracoccaceae bacterium]